MLDCALEDTPSWCVGRPLVFDFELPEETPSNNTIKGMHWQAYRQLRQKWRVRVLSRGLHGRVPATPLERAALVVERHCAGELDWDNAYGGLKPLLDCLVGPSRRNPDGLGLVRDDNPRHMPYPPFVMQLPATRGEGKTRIRIYSLEPK